MTVCEQDYSLLCSGEIDMKDEGLYYHEFDDEIYDEKNLLRLKDGYTVLDMIKESKKANSNWFYINKIFTDPTTGKLYHGITIIEDPICKPVEEYREVGRFSQVRPKGFDSKLAHRVLVDLQENGFKFDEDRMIVVVTIGEDGYYHYEIFEGHHRQHNYDKENVSHMVATGIMIDEDVIAEHYGDVESFILKLKAKLNRDPSACGATSVEDFVTLIQDDILKGVSKKTAPTLSDLTEAQKDKIDDALISKYIESWDIPNGQTKKAVKNRLLAWILDENPQTSKINGMYNYALPGTKKIVQFHSHNIATIALGQHEEFPNVIGGWGGDIHFDYPEYNKLDQFAYTMISSTNINDYIPKLSLMLAHYYIAKSYIEDGVTPDNKLIASHMNKIKNGDWPSESAPIALFSAIDLNDPKNRITNRQELLDAREIKDAEIEKALDTQSFLLESILQMVALQVKNVVNVKSITSSVMQKFVKTQWGVFGGHYPHDPEREATILGARADLIYKQVRKGK